MGVSAGLNCVAMEMENSVETDTEIWLKCLGFKTMNKCCCGDLDGFLLRRQYLVFIILTSRV